MAKGVALYGWLALLLCLAPLRPAAADRCAEIEAAWKDGQAETAKRAFEIFQTALKPPKQVFDSAGSGGGVDACLGQLFNSGVATHFLDVSVDALLDALFNRLCAMVTGWIDLKLSELLAADSLGFHTFRIGNGVAVLGFSVSRSVSRNPWATYSR